MSDWQKLGVKSRSLYSPYVRTREEREGLRLVRVRCLVCSLSVLQPRDGVRSYRTQASNTYAYTQAHMWTGMHTHRHTFMDTYRCAHIGTQTQTCTHVHTLKSTRMCTSTDVHKPHVNTHMHAHVRTYIHAWFPNTEGEEDTQSP